MKYQEALLIANRIKADLAPHCHKIEIAGSIRRRKSEVNDIEIVCIPKPFETGLFSSGIAEALKKYPKIKGELPCKYTRRIDSISDARIDIFFANKHNWGYILLIRTGSKDFVMRLAKFWKSKGFQGKGGFLYRRKRTMVTETEEIIFKVLGLDYYKPEDREVKAK